MIHGGTRRTPYPRFAKGREEHLFDPRRATEDHGEHLLIHGGTRRTEEHLFDPRRAAEGRGEHLNTFFIREDSRRAAKNTFLIHGREDSATKNTFLIHGSTEGHEGGHEGPRRTPFLIREGSRRTAWSVYEVPLRASWWANAVGNSTPVCRGVRGSCRRGRRLRGGWRR